LHWFPIEAATISDYFAPTMHPTPIRRSEAIWSFAAVLVCLFLAALDQTIVSTALPRIVSDLHGLQQYTWVATAYLLTSTALVPIYGKLADVRSHVWIMATAVILFLGGSLLCGLAGVFGDQPIVGGAMNQLIAARALQGIGGSGLFAMAFITIADLFPPTERGKYQGYIGSVWGLSSLVGPFLGGTLTEHAGSWIHGIAGWRWVFLVNLPFGIIALWILFTRMPRRPPHHPDGHVHLGQAALLLSGLVPVLLALSLGGHFLSWTSWQIASLLAGGICLLAAFAAVALRSSTPLLDLRLYRQRTFQAMNSLLLFQGAAFMGMVIFPPLYLINARGFTAQSAGLSLIPMTVGVVVGSALSGQIASKRKRVRAIFLVASPILAASLFLLATLTDSTPTWLFILELALAGMATSPAFPLSALAVQNSVEPRVIGQATALTQFTRQIGGAVGSAALGAILATQVAAHHGVLVPSEYTGVMRSVFLTAGILAGLSCVGAWLLPDLELKGRPAPGSGGHG
jgi:EmrB/QacA subfamily drug resistance transporter